MEHGSRVVTHTGWLGRARNSVCGAFFGVALFVASFALLGWNEGRSVAEVRALSECGASLRRVACGDAPASPPPPADDGALVHISCALADVPDLLDATFGAAAHSPLLARRVQALQWEEERDQRCHKDKIGGGQTCVTDYSYRTAWSSTHVNSDAFHDRFGHANPDAWAAEPMSFAPPALHAGAFRLPQELQARIGAGAGAMPPLAFADAGRACGGALNATPPPGCSWSPDGASGLYYHAGSLASPAVGDLRVSWAASDVTTVSVIGVQVRAAADDVSFAPYYAHSGHTCFLLEAGLLPPEAMIARAKARNAALTWALRAVGCFMNWLGINLFFEPLGVLIDVVPFVGPFVSDVVAFGVGVAASVVSLALCSFTIAVAWVAVRPAVGVPLLLLSLGAGGGLVAARERKRRAGGGGGGGGNAWGHAGAYSPELNAPEDTA
jgi:hypothetical protein